MKINISFTDRVQRTMMGFMLMILNGFNSYDHWNLISSISLLLQIELILTGVLGWCPLSWVVTKKK